MKYIRISAYDFLNGLFWWMEYGNKPYLMCIVYAMNFFSHHSDPERPLTIVCAKSVNNDSMATE